MSKFKLSKEIKVGILAIISIFIVYFGLNFLKGVDVFKPVHYFYGQFTELDGLVPSSPVYIKGYKVGQVESIDFDFLQDKAFTIKISIDKKVALPVHSTIVLFDDGLLGGKAIQLLLASENNTTAFCQSGDTLNSEIQLGLMDQLAAGLLPKIQNITEQTDSLLYSLRAVLSNEAIANSLQAIEKTTIELSESSTSLKHILQTDIQNMIQDVNVITEDFAVISNNLKQVDFASTISEVDATVKDLKGISSKINDGEGSLGLLLTDKNLYDNLLNVSNSADALLIDLREQPKRYVNFSLFGSKNK